MIGAPVGAREVVPGCGDSILVGIPEVACHG